MKSLYRICLDSFLESNKEKHIPFKKFDKGDIVYWVDNNHRKKPYVNVGIVEDSYDGQVYYLKRFEPNFKYVVEIFDSSKDKFVELCNKEDFVNTTYYKLPKKWRKWTYNTSLFRIKDVEEHNDKVREQASKIYIRNPKLIKEGLKNNVIRYKDDYDVKIEAEIDKGCFRLVRKTDFMSNSLSKDGIYLYETYEECKKICDEIEKENIRIANLSDYDYNLEDLNDKLGFIFKDDEIMKERYRKYLLDKDNFEDIELRIFGGDLQWKYWKNKTWLNVDLG